MKESASPGGALYKALIQPVARLHDAVRKLSITTYFVMNAKAKAPADPIRFKVARSLLPNGEVDPKRQPKPPNEPSTFGALQKMTGDQVRRMVVAGGRAAGDALC